MDLLEITKKNNKEKAPFLYKMLSMLSVVRGYNIFLIVVAQYLAALFIFSQEKSLKLVLLDLHLYLIVLATMCVVAAGYIINNFYDSETDRINKPEKSKLDALVNQKTKLKIYFLFNFLGVFFSIFVSLRAAFFYSVYIFLIWFYSHKLKKYPLLGMFSAAILALLPFFAVFVYYKNFSEVIFVHASFLFFILLIKELVKDLEKIKGDVVQDYQTIPIKYGEYFTKMLLTLIVILTFNPVYFLLRVYDVGGMKYYFYLSIVSLIVFTIALWFSTSKQQYLRLHVLLKLLLLIGVFSLCLIDYSVLISRILHF
ncbi:MAG: geranylgeranylglycerol-phosphate geranylgeranyltransferase [Flavobacteriaceae bacterium]|nr:geranylgeranylglycerol-phosphate geranylgeranyltransferase [Flavobacteriaceae bacterium]